MSPISLDVADQPCGPGLQYPATYLLLSIDADLPSLVPESRSESLHQLQLGSQPHRLGDIPLSHPGAQVGTVTVQWLVTVVSRYGTWYLYAGCSLVAIIFFTFTLPETKV